MAPPLRLQVICPAYSVTGGPEALHQLVHTARAIGVDASIVYIDRNPKSSAPLTAEPFRVYDIRVDERIDDAADVLLVVPETETHLLADRRHLRKAIWWLSVDNYHVVVDGLKARGPRPWWKGGWRTPKRPFDLDHPDPEVVHLAQSEYARLFLATHRLRPVFMLTDYLRDDFIAQVLRPRGSARARDRRVAYNPKKGLETTHRIIERAGGAFEFVRIEKMTPAEVVDLLCETAVYMDFGHHPGRDRIPREAVACGCRVLTGRRGAAANGIDLPIPDEFKLDESAPEFVDAALAALRRLTADDADLSASFDPYRRTILAQRQVFEGEVRAVLEAVAALPTVP